MLQIANPVYDVVFKYLKDDDKAGLRRRYSELVRRYHPDRNGGDRSSEGKLQGVVEAYQLLRKAAAFA